MPFHCTREGQKGILGAWEHFEWLKVSMGKASWLLHVLMHSKEGYNKGRVLGASLKDEGEGFRLPKCIVCSREIRMAEGTHLKAEGWRLQAFGVHSYT